ncbi:MAG: GGDEF domain-containing protein [Spirochaetales bacterium]|nr:GGDEF domain-containing protein [Spirochaetales bacterium]
MRNTAENIASKANPRPLKVPAGQARYAGVFGVPVSLLLYGAIRAQAASGIEGSRRIAALALAALPLLAGALNLIRAALRTRLAKSSAAANVDRFRGFVSSVDVPYGFIAGAWASAVAFYGISELDSLAGWIIGVFLSALSLRNHPRLLALGMLLLASTGAAASAFGHFGPDHSLAAFGALGLAWAAADAIRRRAAESLVEIEALERRNSELLELSIRDGLTGLLNRRALAELGANTVAAARRYGDQLQVLMFDIDHFKKVNDSLGHAVGDEVLRQLAEIALSCLRDSDYLARYGGEEFVALLPRANLEDANHVANRLRDTVARATFSRVPWQVTISIGVTGLKPDEEFGNLVERADSFLYLSKQTGRNRVSSG